MTLFVLYLLALLDGMLCGIRTSMGRCPLIRKQNYYKSALLLGLLGAQAISTLSLAALLIAIEYSASRELLRADLEIVASRMLWVFVPYVTLVLFNLALRLIPSTDIRSATSVLMLGPLTAIRPLVMVGGVAYGVSGSRLIETWILGGFILALMLSLEFVLNRHAARLQAIQIRKLIYAYKAQAPD